MTTLTPEERAGLERMSPEDLGKLLSLIREARALFSVKGCVPQSVMDDLVKAVPNQLVRDIVKDLGGGVGQPGWMSPPKPDLEAVMRPDPPKDETPSYLKKENERSGWQKPTELSPPAGIEHIDRIAEHFAALDRMETEKQWRGR